MPTFAYIDVDKLLEPHHPQRQETLMERIDELRDSIRSHGLQQPIGVQVEGESFRILWGHRRSIAATQLKWPLIAAMVYSIHELINPDQLMGAENYHRTQTSDREEALFYKRILPQYAEGTIGIARELNVPQSRVEKMIIVADGDEATFTALGEKKIALQVAVEINKFKSPGYRLQALHRAINEGASADILRRWRSEVQRNNLDQDAEARQVTWATPQPTAGDVPHANCQIGNHMVPLQFRRIYEICNEHYNIFIKGLEALGREETIFQNGLGNEYNRLLAVAEGRTGDANVAQGPANTEGRP